MTLLRYVQHEHAHATDSEHEEGYKAALQAEYIREAMDAQIPSLLSLFQATAAHSSQEPVDHEKRTGHMIHSLRGMEKGLDPYHLSCATQDPLTKCLFYKCDGEYKSDRKISAIFRRLSQDHAVEDFSRLDGTLGHHGKIVVPSCLRRKVVTAMPQYVHPGRDNMMQLLRGRFYFPFQMRGSKKMVTELVKRCPICQTCKIGPARFEKCKYFPVLQYQFASFAIDFVSLPQVTESGQMFDRRMVLVDRLTGYVTALGCQVLGLDAKRVADSFVQRVFCFTGIPEEIMSDNANAITCHCFRSLLERMGIETHKEVVTRPSSNGRAENAVKSVVNVVLLYWEQRKALWVQVLPLAVWAANDLPGINSPYSPHRLVFGRDSIGFGDCPRV